MDDYISLLRRIDGIDEAWEERRFSVYYKRVALTVVVSDQGPGSGTSRFQVSVMNDQGAPEMTTGHAYPTLKEALDDVNWWVFE